MGVRVATRSEIGSKDGVPLPSGPGSSLTERLAAARRDGARRDGARQSEGEEDAPLAMWVEPTDGPLAAVVTAAVEAGATLIVVPDELDSDPAVRRDIRRAADVASALVRERRGDGLP